MIKVLLECKAIVLMMLVINMTAIGIDLGTTNCCIAVVQRGKIKIIPQVNNKHTIPSIISFWKNELLFGESAKMRQWANLENTIYDIKRIIGQNYNSIMKHVDMFPFKVINQNNKPLVEVKGSKYTTEELSGLLLMELKRVAEMNLKEKITKAVVTVPTYFNNAQRQATLNAGKIAGFTEVRLINEPTAAAVAHSVINRKLNSRLILVFDFGGGTFDVSLVRCENQKIEVIAIDGNVNLGGNDIDLLLLNYIQAKFKLNLSGKLLYRFRRMCEQIKKELSTTSEAVLESSEFSGLEEDVTLTREEFDKINLDVFNELRVIIERCLVRANVKVEEVDEVLMVGGSSNITAIITMLENYFKKDLKFNINPDEAVAVGAAILASKFTVSNEFPNVSFTDISPYTIGTSILNVASYQKDIVYKGDIMFNVIPKFSKLPISREKSYCTTLDMQDSITIELYSGENYYVKDNFWLGSVTIQELPLKNAGEVKVLVSYELQADGVLQVSVINSETRQSKKLVLELDKGKGSENEVEVSAKKIAELFKESLKVLYFKQQKTQLAELCQDAGLNHIRSFCDKTSAWLRTAEYSTSNVYQIEKIIKDLQKLKR